MPRTAKCLCGAFSVAVSAEPMMVNVCHCRDCQRRSGVPWTSNAYFPREAVTLHGPNNIYTRTSNAGTRITHHFCPTCGSPFLGSGDRLHAIWDSGWGIQRPVVPRPIGVLLGRSPIRVVARDGQYGSLGPATASSSLRPSAMFAPEDPTRLEST